MSLPTNRNRITDLKNELMVAGEWEWMEGKDS